MKFKTKQGITPALQKYISIKNKSFDGTATSYLMATSIIFNNYFSAIANKNKLNISFSNKHFSDFLKIDSIRTSFLSQNDKTRIDDVISSVDSNKSVCRYSISTKIIVKNYISIQLSGIFDISFSSGAFPLKLKNCKLENLISEISVQSYFYLILKNF